MYFPLIVYKDNTSDYGAFFPDFPGCYSMAATLDELLSNAQDAVETWMLGEPAKKFPSPSAPELVLASPDAKGRAVFFVDIDTSFLDAEAELVNISLPRNTLNRIDEEANALGLSRSAFLDKAVQSLTF
ncbi:MAG: type II toxin-antitoxin system HicB family antitoxin [Desulfovibrionaceae bacterium]|nr:type II toxin-antitoxin system HicB family antitoxin [Desulfovibrionaceae bacterium]